MNIPETFYIALCVAILLLGVIYWFWTQIQYLQKKVNLLDNVVYEMKTFVSNLPGHSSTPAFRAEVENHISRQSPNEEIYHSPPPSEEVYHPPPDSIAGDLESERVASEIEFEPFSGAIEKTEAQLFGKRRSRSTLNFTVSDNFKTLRGAQQ